MRALKHSDTETKKTEVCGMTKDQMIETKEKMNKAILRKNGRIYFGKQHSPRRQLIENNLRLLLMLVT